MQTWRELASLSPVPVGNEESNFSGLLAPNCKTSCYHKGYEKFVSPLEKAN